MHERLSGKTCFNGTSNPTDVFLSQNATTTKKEEKTPK